MDVFAGLGVVGVILVAWGTISVGAALIIWTTLVASKGLKPAESQRVAPLDRPATEASRSFPENVASQPRLVIAISPGTSGEPRSAVVAGRHD